MHVCACPRVCVCAILVRVENIYIRYVLLSLLFVRMTASLCERSSFESRNFNLSPAVVVCGSSITRAMLSSLRNSIFGNGMMDDGDASCQKKKRSEKQKQKKNEQIVIRTVLINV